MTSYLLADCEITLFQHLQVMIFGVWIVIVIEAFIVQMRIGHSTLKAYSSVTLANLLSTFIGIPITWFVSLIFMYWVTHIIPHSSKFSEKIEMLTDLMGDSGILVIEVPAHVALFVTVFLLIPYYYMSVFIEYFVIKHHYKDVESVRVKRAVILMNRITYILLGSLMLINFLLGEFSHWGY